MRSSYEVASKEVLENIEESHSTRLAGVTLLGTQANTWLLRKGLQPIKGGVKRGVRDLIENIEGCLNAYNLRFVFRALKKLHSKSIYHIRTIQKSVGEIISDQNEYLAHYTKYFEQLYRGDPPSHWLPRISLQMVAADSLINKTPPSLGEMTQL